MILQLRGLFSTDSYFSKVSKSEICLLHGSGTEVGDRIPNNFNHASTRDLVFFEKGIRPLLINKLYEKHCKDKSCLRFKSSDKHGCKSEQREGLTVKRCAMSCRLHCDLGASEKGPVLVI